jgi:hypothetical protein
MILTVESIELSLLLIGWSEFPAGLRTKMKTSLTPMYEYSKGVAFVIPIQTFDHT